MTARENIILDLINDPICVALMNRDGVKRHDVLALMRATRPLVTRERSPLRGHGCPRVTGRDLAADRA